jgi:hypothetical protein
MAHEVVHLAVPDHSRRFWLTLHSIYPAVDDARNWRRWNESMLRVLLGDKCNWPKTDCRRSAHNLSVQRNGVSVRLKACYWQCMIQTVDS